MRRWLIVTVAGLSVEVTVGNGHGDEVTLTTFGVEVLTRSMGDRVELRRTIYPWPQIARVHVERVS